MKIAFQKISHLAGSGFRKIGPADVTPVVRCELLGTSSGPMRRGSQRREIPGMGYIEYNLRWRPFPVKFAASVETTIAGGENWSLLL